MHLSRSSYFDEGDIKGGEIMIFQLTPKYLIIDCDPFNPSSKIIPGKWY
jgi:hypothetical protein